MLVDSSVVSAIDSTLQHYHDKDDAMKVLFTGARNVAQSQIADLLSDFRQKRQLGHIVIVFVFSFVWIFWSLLPNRTHSTQNDHLCGKPGNVGLLLKVREVSGKKSRQGNVA